MRHRTGAFALLFATTAAPLAAQTPFPGEAHWFLKGLQTGLCVEFLVSPSSVADQYRSGVTPTPVESLAGRYPALARVAAAEVAYRGWIPAEYCWYLYRSAVLNGRELQVSGGKEPAGVGYLAIPATGLPDSAEMVVVTLFTNVGALSRSAEVNRLLISGMDIRIGLIPSEEDSPDHRRYIAKHGSTIVQWDGYPGEARPPEPQAIRLALRTVGGGLRRVEASFTSDSSFVALGNFGVAGTGPLQLLLSASPIRLFSPLMRGGDADWSVGK